MSKQKGEGPESVAGKSERTNLPLEESTRKNGYKYSGLVQTVCIANICTLLVHKLSVSTGRKLNMKVNENILVNSSEADADKKDERRDVCKNVTVAV